MTSKPELARDSNLLPGLAAVSLFVVFVLIVLGAEFQAAAGFPSDVSITASIGYAMFDVAPANTDIIASEPFLVAFEIIDIVLVAALVGAVMLASREQDGTIVAALRTQVQTATDGGEVVTDDDDAPGADADAADEPTRGGAD